MSISSDGDNGKDAAEAEDLGSGMDKLLIRGHNFQTEGEKMDLKRTTEWMEWMWHMKQKETKQAPGTSGPGNILGCCLVSPRLLCDIHSIHPVTQMWWTNWGGKSKNVIESL